MRNALEKMGRAMAAAAAWVAVASGLAGAQPAARPFPQGVAFPGMIRPAVVARPAMDKAVLDYWTYYKGKYVRPSNGRTPGGGYYVEMKGTGGDGSEKTTSEAHGYGMIFCALMAGADPDAKKLYDGFYNMYDKHRSTGDKDLMSWVISESETGGSSSATDGDMDIAYSLLLAHYQWGSAGAIDYLAEAKRMATDGIKASEMGASSYRTLLGDWAKGRPLDTRPSDWMAGHFEAWRKHTGDEFWAKAKANVYAMVARIQADHSASTGLVPDFVVGDPARPAPANFLEFQWDGHYYYNACRFPLRIAVDLAHNGTPEAKAALGRMVGWLKTRTGNDPAKITAGYRLDGGNIGSYSENAFTAPFLAAAISDPAHQAFLDKGWPLLLERNDYYSDSIALLSLLIVTGNWWKPDEPGGTTALSWPRSGRPGARGRLLSAGGAPAIDFAGSRFGMDGRCAPPAPAF